MIFKRFYLINPGWKFNPSILSHLSGHAKNLQEIIDFINQIGKEYNWNEIYSCSCYSRQANNLSDINIWLLLWILNGTRTTFSALTFGWTECRMGSYQKANTEKKLDMIKQRVHSVKFYSWWDQSGWFSISSCSKRSPIISPK